MADIDRTEWTESDWNWINGFVFADGLPNHWIKLLDAVKYIATELKVLPGEARALLQFEAHPPAVPWVSKVLIQAIESGPGGRLVETDEFIESNAIERSWLVDADFNFNFETVRQPGHRIMYNVHVERNHLEAWLEKRRAPVPHLVQQDQSSSAKPRVNGGRPPLPLKGDVQLALEAFRVKRGAAWLKDRTTGQLAKELRKAFDNKKPPVSLPARSTLEGWIDEWRDERKL
jgi:hypothetical protein